MKMIEECEMVGTFWLLSQRQEAILWRGKSWWWYLSKEGDTLTIADHKLVLERIGDIRLEGASDTNVATGNFDHDASHEMAMMVVDGLGRGALLVYDIQGPNNIKRIGDFRIAPLVSDSIQADIVCGNLDLEEATDEIVTFFFRTLHLPKPPAPVQPSKYNPESMAEFMRVKTFVLKRSGKITSENSRQPSFVYRLINSTCRGALMELGTLYYVLIPRILVLTSK